MSWKAIKIIAEPKRSPFQLSVTTSNLIYPCLCLPLKVIIITGCV